ncbi:MAG: hypothetical protein CL920_37320 [Deltaproteobacteria bacterium]|nr:hypothetical protein [Deltaproteobacteria bacterium]MBU54393.1 hypothetical protein [Deltaproteobacteria bacterium]|tara:strand:+ start:365 stop:1108 length:744 start_codon:yes stop_codon:yes gene_type:complete
MQLDDLFLNPAYQTYLEIKKSPFADQLSFVYWGPCEFSVCTHLQDYNTRLQKVGEYWYRWTSTPNRRLLKFASLEDVFLYKNPISCPESEFSDPEWRLFCDESQQHEYEALGWFEDVQYKEPDINTRASDTTLIPWPFPCSGFKLLILDHIISRQLRTYMSEQTDMWYAGSIVSHPLQYQSPIPPKRFPFGFSCENAPFLTNASYTNCARFQFYKEALAVRAKDKSFLRALTPPASEEIQKAAELYA